MRIKYPFWLRPVLKDAVADMRTARARLGGQTMHSHLTEPQQTELGKKLQKAWMQKTTFEQRSGWARIAAQKRWERREP